MLPTNRRVTRSPDEGAPARCFNDRGVSSRAAIREGLSRITALRASIRATLRDLGRERFEMHFEIIGEISDVETFAIGSSIREVARFRRIYGRGRWRKRKGIARVRLADGSLHLAEVH